MQVKMGRAGTALVLEICEKRLDAAVALSFKDRVSELARHEGTPVILDLSQVTFLDSSGLGAVVGVMKMLGSDRPLEIAGLTPPVQKLFRLTRMDTVFRLHAQAPHCEPIAANG